MVNPHLRSLDHVIGLAQAEANKTREDQAIYKTKDQQRYEIYKFIPEKDFKGNAIRIVRYAREDKHEVILQDSGNEQPVIVGEKPRGGKKRGLRNNK